MNLLLPQAERGSSASAGTVAPTHEAKKACQMSVDQVSYMRPDLPQPTHGLIPEDLPRSVLFI